MVINKISFLPRLIIGIILGIIVGLALPGWFGRILYTFTHIFGELLSYIIPLIIVSFISTSIASLGAKAGRFLAGTAGLAYLSSFAAGIAAFFISLAVISLIVEPGAAGDPEAVVLTPYLELNIPPVMGVVTALITGFILGLGINALRQKTRQVSYLFNVMEELRAIVVIVINKVIIPFLPFYIAGIFADMAATGEAFKTLSVFGQVFILIILMHLGYLVVKFSIAGIRTGNNPFKALKNMAPAYTTALGTNSSAATIPVSLRSAKSNGVSKRIAEFVVPFSANIHLPGSTITLVTCSVAVVVIGEGVPEFSKFLPFIIMLGVTMILAPGIPGGGVVAALGLMSSILGFTEPEQGLMLALYKAQDGLGTACNVTGDGALSMIVDSFSKNSSSGEAAAVYQAEGD